jgi:FAD/FMN-containing dehydrogenase
MTRFFEGALLLLMVVGQGLPLPVLADEIVNDITQLNPIRVRKVLAPGTIAEVVEAVRTNSGPISIGGGRFSMGGQTATDGALQIDMRHLDHIVSFSKEKKEITVQAGITWRKVLEYIDPYDLSVEIMQSYANFTVGGALSVNAHGRYVGLGPIVLSVKSIRLVLADGAVVFASPDENADLFYGAIGGYGGLGVIVEATLRLTDDVHVELDTHVMPLSAYRGYFASKVRDNGDVIFHNAVLYPPNFDTVRVLSYIKTSKSVTVADRLVPADSNYNSSSLGMSIVSSWPGGKWVRQHVFDVWKYRGHEIEWRNYEASFDVRELEPASRKASTYVLQEYFVPVDQLESFTAQMGGILRRHRVNAINLSIRHARQDPGTLLAWARSEVFSCVLYYKQGTSDNDRTEVQTWTRELIDSAVAHGGTYYLPYQIAATREQFHAAYPNAPRLFALKRRADPLNKFRNRLWDMYFDPAQ